MWGRPAGSLSTLADGEGKESGDCVGQKAGEMDLTEGLAPAGKMAPLQTAPETCDGFRLH